jgi:hypothetical protein
MRKIPILILTLLFLTCSIIKAISNNSSTEQNSETNLEIKDGWYFINGQKFFVNALGYEIGARPGQHPYVKRYNEPERVKQDMKVIKEAGFNAVRTWSELFEEELQVVQESGLKLIFGVNIRPEEEFGDPEIIKKNMDHLKKVIAYSKKYDCIITYLIMNEPMPEHIKKVGAKATVDLWEMIRDYIHKEHPGIPVTISGNSAITEFVDMNVFDIYAYNAYVYDGFNYTHGYTNSAKMLPEMNGQGKPLLLTEFGMSVSREGWGKYGGNTLTAQMEILPWYYRQILDAGAAGVCPFYYADGWWKGGEPSVHNDTPEEWFGFWGYKDLQDTIGYPRPVWKALTEYNLALISSPRNQTFYKNEIPIEIFFLPEVKSMKVIYHDEIIYSNHDISNNYLVDKIFFTDSELKDRELTFEFFNADDELIKSESIVMLTGAEDIDWPKLTLTSSLNNLDESEIADINLDITNDTLFTLDNEVRYLFSTHIGWSKGERRKKSIDPSKEKISFSDSYKYPPESPLLGLYAGMEIRYGKFVKTIHDEKLIYKGTWADPIRIK